MTTEPLAVLKADAGNPRTISEAALAGLGVSVEEYGDLSGIVFNLRTGELVCGHQRVQALARAGAVSWTRTGPTATGEEAGFIEHPKTGERFAVRLVSWDVTRQRMANLVANSPGIAGEFTPLALEQLKALEQEALYEALRLDVLQSTLAAELEVPDPEPAAGNTDPDAVPEPPPEPVTRPGDLWVLGDHRLLCGDATRAEDVARLMRGARAVLMNTDPPYGVDYNRVKQGIAVDGKQAFKDWGNIENDTLDPAELAELLRAAFAAAGSEALAPAPAFYIWHPPGELSVLFRRAMTDAAILVHRTITWVKPRFVLSRLGMYHWRHEPCFFGWRTGSLPPWFGEMNQTSVWEVGRDDGAHEHPTQKPVRLFEIPMENHTRAGEICYEPFAGSGSQIIAGERLGRRVFALEKAPRWVDVAVARWEAFAGKKAHREQAP